MTYLNPDRSYTFSDIFKLNASAIDLVPEYGYTIDRNFFEFPKYEGDLPFIDSLRVELRELLPLVDLTNEQARRETLIAPIISHLCRFSQSRLSIERPIYVNNQLQGNLDYLIRNNRLLVIEAKQSDLENGFTQLAVELIAMDQSDLISTNQDTIKGAVTTGETWRLGQLHRARKHIEQDISILNWQNDIEALARMLLHPLMSDE